MSNHVNVRHVEYLSRDSEEALVHLTDGVYECVAFCQPCDKSAGDSIKQPLLAYGVRGVSLTSSDIPFIKRIGFTFEHEISAKILNIESGLLEIGDIQVELDQSLPGGLEVGDTVHFYCQRLDLI